MMNLEGPAKDIWKKLIQVHFEAKSLFILAEENELREFKDFIQPVQEQRHAQEHIMRAAAVAFGTNFAEKLSEDDVALSIDDRVIKQLDKALGHEYRAFFDAADWLMIECRERAQEALSKYSHEEIAANVPDYFPSIRPALEKAAALIGQERKNKDIIKTEDIIPAVERYKKVLETTLTLIDKIELGAQALATCRTVSVTVQECKTRIHQAVAPYDNEIIRDVIPEYYTVISPRITSLSAEVKGPSINAGEAKRISDEAIALAEKVDALKETLEERSKAGRRKNTNAGVRKVGITAIIVILTLMIQNSCAWLKNRVSTIGQKKPNHVEQSRTPSNIATKVVE